MACPSCEWRDQERCVTAFPFPCSFLCLPPDGDKRLDFNTLIVKQEELREIDGLCQYVSSQDNESILFRFAVINNILLCCYYWVLKCDTFAIAKNGLRGSLKGCALKGKRGPWRRSLGSSEF